MRGKNRLSVLETIDRIRRCTWGYLTPNDLGPTKHQNRKKGTIKITIAEIQDCYTRLIIQIEGREREGKIPVRKLMIEARIKKKFDVKDPSLPVGPHRTPASRGLGTFYHLLRCTHRLPNHLHSRTTAHSLLPSNGFSIPTDYRPLFREEDPDQTRKATEMIPNLSIDFLSDDRKNR